MEPPWASAPGINGSASGTEQFWRGRRGGAGDPGHEYAGRGYDGAHHRGAAIKSGRAAQETAKGPEKEKNETEQISLEALAQRKNAQTAAVAQPETAAQLETQIEDLTPEQRSRVNELKESIDLMDSQASIQYGVGAQRNISSFADNNPDTDPQQGQRLCGRHDVGADG